MKKRAVDRVVITGPTGAGKSGLAVSLYRQFPGLFEIISVDSVQIYRSLDIGSGKVSSSVRKEVPHHLVDILDPHEKYDLSRFCADAASLEHQIHSRERIPLFVGGTLLYLEAYINGVSPMPETDPALRKMLADEADVCGVHSLHTRLQTLDPESAARIHRHDAQRIIRALAVCMQSGRTMSSLRQRKTGGARGTSLCFALMLPRGELYTAINHRFDTMIEAGLVEEVAALRRRGYSRLTPALQTIGYAQIAAYLDGEISLNAACTAAKRMTRKYAKKQLTWINRIDRCIKVEKKDSDDIVAHIKRRVEAGHEH